MDYDTTKKTSTVVRDGGVPEGTGAPTRPGPRSYKERNNESSSAAAKSGEMPKASIKLRRVARARVRGCVSSNNDDDEEDDSETRSRSPSRVSRDRRSRSGSRDTDPIIDVADEEMVVSDASRASSSSSMKRKRGRPQTTGDPSKGGDPL